MAIDALFINDEIVPASPLAVTISEFCDGFIVIVTVPDVALVPIEFVAVKLILKLPLTVGVPVMAPVVVFKDNPAGNAPPVMAKPVKGELVANVDKLNVVIAAPALPENEPLETTGMPLVVKVAVTLL